MVPPAKLLPCMQAHQHPRKSQAWQEEPRISAWRAEMEGPLKLASQLLEAGSSGFSRTAYLSNKVENDEESQHWPRASTYIDIHMCAHTQTHSHLCNKVCMIRISIKMSTLGGNHLGNAFCLIGSSSFFLSFFNQGINLVAFKDLQRQKEGPKSENKMRRY